MTMYRKKSNTEAIQLTIASIKDSAEFLSEAFSMEYSLDKDSGWLNCTFKIKTIYGKKVIHLGDYVIKDESGDYHVVKTDIFEKNYELLDYDFVQTSERER